MLKYPSLFETSGHKIYALDDYLDPLVATQGNWNSQINPLNSLSASGLPSLGTITVGTLSGVASPTYGPGPSGGASELTIQVAGITGAPVPTGTVVIYVGGVNVGGPYAVVPGGFSVGLFVPNASVSTYQVQVIYSGDANYPASTAMLAIPNLFHGPFPDSVVSNTPIVQGGQALQTAINNSPSKYEMLDANPVAGDFAQVEYVGWGFRMKFRSSPSFGLCDIYVDGVLFVSALDLSNGTAAASTTGPIPHPAIVGGLVVLLEMPLDKHRVKVVARNAPGALSTANGVIFPIVEVMH